MTCPQCGSDQVKVSNTRQKFDKTYRQRTCLKCCWLWHTVEVDEEWYRKKLLLDMSTPEIGGDGNHVRKKQPAAAV